MDRINSNDNTTKSIIISKSNQLANYISVCGDLKSKVESKHKYKVTFRYSKNGLINSIKINY